jgi:hypothetical protein
MIVWGGEDSSGLLNTGGRYNPVTDSWTATSIINAPTAREFSTTVWSNREMIVWGGHDSTGHILNTGGRYNPLMDSWTATAMPPHALPGRYLHTAVWAGSEMIIWDGYNLGDLDSGGRYNPITDSWTATTTTNAPNDRYQHTAVWTGSEMIVWAGFDHGVGDLNTGGRYNPRTDSWTATTTTNAPSARVAHTAVWTGSEMIVWGGTNDNFVPLKTGGRYCAQPAPPITLTAAIRKVEGINTVHLSWSGAISRKIDVYRCIRQDSGGYDCNPIPIVTTGNDGFYTDSTGDTGRASYKYRVCEEGTSTCSNTAEVPQ